MINSTLNAWIDGRPITTKLGHTIMQGCNLLSIDIPRFCYHEKLSIAGNCRICLVEVSNNKKLVVSCAAHLMEGLAVQTNSVRVKLARQGVIEFLLANHPLDCPICDQGGECDLQDITMVFGADRGRFYEYKKKAVANKDFGPLIKTSMNRCIHCTRCVRFISEVSNSYVLGTTGRGAHLEISTYISMALNDELSGNIIDLCPVGALTSKPYAFQSRPWELTSIESLDVMDSLVSNVYIETAFNKVKRILPCLNEALNEDWITNRARFSYDGLTAQRLTSCYLKLNSTLIFSTENKNKWISKKYFLKISWLTAFYVLNWALLDKLTGNILITNGCFTDFNSISSAKFFFNNLGLSSLAHNDFYNHKNIDFNFLFSFNVLLKEFAFLPTFCILVGLNLRMEIPHLNLKIRKMVNDWNTPIYSIGAATNYSNFFITNISNNLSTLYKILEFKHVFCKNFYKINFSFHPFFLISNNITDIVKTNLTAGILSFLERLFKSKSYDNFIFADITRTINPWDCVSFANDYSARMNANAVGFTPGIHGYVETDFNFTKFKDSSIRTIFYSINDDGNYLNKIVANQNINKFLVYQGSHGNGLANSADLILPTMTYVEKESSYLTINNSMVTSRVVLAAPKQTKQDSAIFSAFYEFYYKKNLNFFFFKTVNFKNSFQYASIHMGYLNKLRASYFFTANDVSVNYFFIKTDFTRIKLNLYLLLAIFGKHRIRHLNFSQLTHTLLSYFNSSLFFTISRPINTYLLNYYSDDTNMILGASKVMVSCSNIFLKKNFSFSQYYIF